MAYNTNPGNPLAGFSGKLNGVVIKQYKGMTVMAGLPRKSNKKPTEKKKAVNDLWCLATLYAKTVVKNPDWKLAIAIALKIEQGKVYSTLLGDFMKNKGEQENMLKIPPMPGGPKATTGR
ncbi:hypothetical protein [Flavihumibacter profundi]|uniref:hypothetical protein n=1 Tax=Flavihumibacter profundi TaxID=2716883 RepID=UPI001CC4909E|nr:hypothetical protein [Flavihumibacter profundi]MBZ5858142.1 hypothetical protein [Flavihumibacter profundi]